MITALVLFSILAFVCFGFLKAIRQKFSEQKAKIDEISQKLEAHSVTISAIYKARGALPEQVDTKINAEIVDLSRKADIELRKNAEMFRVIDERLKRLERKG